MKNIAQGMSSGVSTVGPSGARAPLTVSLLNVIDAWFWRVLRIFDRARQ